MAGLNNGFIPLLNDGIKYCVIDRHAGVEGGDDGGGRDVIPGDYVCVSYQGEFGDGESTDFPLSEERVFVDRKKWVVRIGDADLVPALELAVRHLVEGERAVVRGEGRFVYGPVERKAAADDERRDVPANATCRFLCELHKVYKQGDGLEDGEILMWKKKVGNDHFIHEDYEKAKRTYIMALKSIEK